MKKTYKASLDSLEEIYSDIENFCEENGVDDAAAYAVNLCVDEVFTNTVIYGYKNDASKSVEIEIISKNGEVKTVMRDTAPKFDPVKNAEKPDTSSPVESRDIGGLGIFFLQKNMDSVSYSNRKGINELVLVKKIPAQPKAAE